MNPLVVFETIDDSSAQVAQVIADCLGSGSARTRPNFRLEVGGALDIVMVCAWES
jgi:hypothetical protein